MSEKLPKEVNLGLEKAMGQITSAEILLTQQQTDDALSRMYYAVFHAIAAALRYAQVDLSTHKHTYILNQFRKHFLDTKIIPLIEYAEIISLKNARETADYSIEVHIDSNDAVEFMKETKEIVQKIKDYLINSANKSI